MSSLLADRLRKRFFLCLLSFSSLRKKVRKSFDSFFAKAGILFLENWKNRRVSMLTRIISLCIFLLAINIAYGNKIGLDSGHSIKELYKSGGVSTVQVVNAQGIPEPKPYFSIGWPAGGVKWDYISSMSKKNAYKYYVMITNSVDFPDWRHYFSLDPFSLSEKTGSDSEKRFYFQDIRFFKVRVSSPLPSPSSCIANFA